MQNYENAYDTHKGSEYIDSHFDSRAQEQKHFGYTLDTNFGNVFKSHTKIKGNLITDGSVPFRSGTNGSGLGSTWRFLLPKNNGYLSQIFIKTRVKCSVNLENVLFSGALVFDEILLRNDDTFIIDRVTPHYQYARLERESNSNHTMHQIMNNTLTYKQVDVDTYEVISMPMFHSFEDPSLFLNSNYLRQMTLDLTFAKTPESMNIELVHGQSLEILDIDVTAVYYILHNGIRSLDRFLNQLSVNIYVEQVHKVNTLLNSIKVPIECDRGPFELILQVINPRFRFLPIKRFIIYENNRPVIDIDRSMNFVKSTESYDNPVGSLIYNFGLDHSRIHKTGIFPLDNANSYYLEVFYESPQPGDSTEYSLHTTWAYFEPRVISPDGLITNYGVV